MSGALLLLAAGLGLLNGGAAMLLLQAYPGDGTRPAGFAAIAGGVACLSFLIARMV